jgi:polysaccharide pyruvyl transferase WcaK-like protein
MFIGTRLHSTIFAMGEMVPSICISYHGTKSSGIFSNYNLERFVIVNYSDQSLIKSIDELLENIDEIKKTIEEKHNYFKVRFENLFNELFQ